MSQARAQSILKRQRLVQTLSSLRHRNYRLYWFGQLTSVLAQNMEGVAQSWLVLELTESPLLLGLTGLTFAIPTITLTLLGGVIADRADRKRIMIVSQLASAMNFFVLATLILAGRVQLWHVMAAAFLSGCIRAFDRPSRMALLPQMVPKEDIPNAVAVGGTIWQLNRLVGPAVAGILIYLIGIGPTYAFCCFASVGAVLLWIGIRFEHSVPEPSSDGMLQHMMAGLDFIWKNETYYTFIGMTFFTSVFGMSYLILMPVFARNVLAAGSQGFGFLQSAGGVGSLFGVFCAAYLAQSGAKGRQTIAGAVVFGVLLMIFALSTSYPLSLLLACALGMASQFYTTTINAILQVNLPDPLRGRVMGIYGLAWDLMPVGGMIFGAIAEFAGAPIAVAIGGALVVSTALGVAAFFPNVRRLEQ
jgi:MFS family permease